MAALDEYILLVLFVLLLKNVHNPKTFLEFGMGHNSCVYLLM